MENFRRTTSARTNCYKRPIFQLDQIQWITCFYRSRPVFKTEHENVDYTLLINKFALWVFVRDLCVYCSCHIMCARPKLLHNRNWSPVPFGPITSDLENGANVSVLGVDVVRDIPYVPVTIHANSLLPGISDYNSRNMANRRLSTRLEIIHALCCGTRSYCSILKYFW